MKSIQGELFVDGQIKLIAARLKRLNPCLVDSELETETIKLRKINMMMMCRLC